MPTPTFGLRMKRFWTQDWRSWAGTASIAVVAMFIWMMTRGSTGAEVPLVTARDTTARVVAPAGATTGASTGARTGATTGTLAGAAASDSARAPGSAGTGGSTKTPPSRTAGTGTKTTALATARPPTRPANRAGASRCPARPQEFTVMLDSVPDQRRSATLPVSYDVCGLAEGTKFVAEIRFRRAGGVLRGESTPIRRAYPDEAAGTRERRRQLIELAPLSPGRYKLDVVVTREGGIDRGKTIEFRVDR
jgi:hypothetical protein